MGRCKNVLKYLNLGMSPLLNLLDVFYLGHFQIPRRPFFKKSPQSHQECPRLTIQHSKAVVTFCLLFFSRQQFDKDESEFSNFVAVILVAEKYKKMFSSNINAICLKNKENPTETVLQLFTLC